MTATFTDGTVAKYRSLREVLDVATDVLYDLALPTGKRNVGSSVSIFADPQRPLVFTPNNVVGRHYWLGLGEEGLSPEFGGFRFRLDGNGTGSREYELVDQLGNIEIQDVTQQDAWGLFWYIDGQDLIEQRTQRAPGDYNCSLATPPCVVSDERRRMPLASDGARTYELELYRTDSFGVGELSHRQTYVGMYDFVPFDDSSANSKPTVTGKHSARQAVRAIEAARLKKLEMSR